MMLRVNQLIGFGRSRTFSSGPSDPFFSNVVFLAEYEGTDGQTSYTDLKGHSSGSFSGTARIESDQSHYGSTSLYVGNSGVGFPDSNDWDLSDANSDQFTVELSVRQETAMATQFDVLGHWGAFGSFSWLIRVNSTGSVSFFWSNSGTDVNGFATTGVTLTTGTWNDICVEKNSSGKIRIYVDGVMRASNTPANSTFFHSSATFGSFNHETSNGYIDHVRITKGVARYDSDSGYTPSTGAFPTS